MLFGIRNAKYCFGESGPIWEKIRLTRGGRGVAPDGCPTAAVLAGSARSHLRPRADRTACGACETYGTGPSHFPSNGRRSGAGRYPLTHAGLPYPIPVAFRDLEASLCCDGLPASRLNPMFRRTEAGFRRSPFVSFRQLVRTGSPHSGQSQSERSANRTANQCTGETTAWLLWLGQYGVVRIQYQFASAGRSR